MKYVDSVVRAVAKADMQIIGKYSVIAIVTAFPG